ncbi:hypothetical protein Athai_11960 [Actinocatenispora thailandica]|uniref:Uncharacterized protein n=1 Tax=Actinocatenispora thailandica TaxID=227318 RepID=A0A7R7HVF4_9ACTN|nr:hypothetical protein [Actinocatenispora thailandica]BCJ33693.1 hypothetical protein Athai_11960 [Actinocatenispora thailandica]
MRSRIVIAAAAVALVLAGAAAVAYQLRAVGHRPGCPATAADPATAVATRASPDRSYWTRDRMRDARGANPRTTPRRGCTAPEPTGRPSRHTGAIG